MSTAPLHPSSHSMRPPDLDVMPQAAVPPRPSLPHSPLILRREDMRVRDQAGLIVQRAEQHAQEIRRQAEHDAIEQRRLGYEDGVRDGRTETGRLLAEAAATVDMFYADREEELTELAFAIAHRLIGELPPREQIRRLAQAAVAEHRGGVRLKIRVSPHNAEDLRAAVGAFDTEGRVEVEVDDNAVPGTCTLVHPRGRASIGLLDQFRALIDTVRSTP